MRYNAKLEDKIKIDVSAASAEDSLLIEEFMKAREEEARIKEQKRIESNKNRGEKISKALKRKSELENGQQLGLFD